jgi:hypothetical protein
MLTAGMMAYFIHSGAKRRVQEGQSPLAATAVESFWTLPTFLFRGGFASQMVKGGLWMSIPSLVKAGAGAYNYFASNYNSVRQRAIPFSQRFEHSDTSYALQQRGLQLMGASNSGLGSEAYLMHCRYNRSG